MSASQIDAFYEGLASRDAEAMVRCYHESAVFEDPVFGELPSRDACDMWRMLCASDTDLRIRHTILEADEETATVNWVADYTFSTTGRQVTNKVTATMEFEDGLIVDHRDEFSFWKWSAQALGFPGMVFGWLPMLRTQVRSRSRSNLDAFQTRSD